MDSENANLPPKLEAAPPPRGVSRRRWWIHVAVLAAYPMVLGALAGLQAGSQSGPLLPRGSLQLVGAAGLELAVFAVIFLLAVAASRVSAGELLLPWRGGPWPVLRGFGYAVALRAGLAVLAIVTIMVVRGLGVGESGLKRMVPHPEAVIDARSMSDDPLYLWLVLTLISFVVAGLREELWRAGMLAGLRALFPRQFQGLGGGLAAVGLVAVVFGIGHAPQGPAAAVLTALLGAGLGAIMVWHRTVWDAVFAHGFFDATTFLMLSWLARMNPPWLQGG